MKTQTAHFLTSASYIYISSNNENLMKNLYLREPEINFVFT